MNKIILLLLVFIISIQADIIQKANKKYIMGDFKRAAKYMPDACKKDDAKSCYLAGYLFVNGIGVTQDIKRAIEFYAKSCKLGYKKACKYEKKYSKKDSGIVKRFNTQYNPEFKR